MVSILRISAFYYPQSLVRTSNKRPCSNSITSVSFPNYYPVFKGTKNLSPLNETERESIYKLISNTPDKDIKHGSLGNVYKAELPMRPALAVKEFRTITDNRNAEQEAEILKLLPEECNRVQRYVDLFKKNGRQFLVSTYKNGRSLSVLKDKMPKELLKNILDELFKIEKSGLVFYDYSMANIVYSDNEPGFFDFETTTKQNLLTPNKSALSDLCHLSRNTYFPALTNLAGFEIRTVGKIIAELEKYPDGEMRSSEFTKKYLIELSKFYEKMYLLMKKNKTLEGADITIQAVEYNKTLSDLFNNPIDEVVSIEMQSMRIKELLTEYWFQNDPNLEHDSLLYSNLRNYIDNLEERFSKIQKSIQNLSSKTQDSQILEYCKTNSEFHKKLSDKEIKYLTQKLFRK